ncbi:MAG: hypothetical protein JJT96_13380 [Opitutales bacterium]|nr:hypothetical protein [Opitutales bacterium]
MKTKHTALAVAGLCLALVPAFSAAGPNWWKQYGILDPTQEGDNFSPLNVGQLKFVATQARAYFDAYLPGGAGHEIHELIDSFGTGSDLDHFAPANVGQLKAVAKLFYDRLADSPLADLVYPRLIAAGLYPDQITSTTVVYPWAVETNYTDHYRPANIGQLKIVFSFDLTPALTLPFSTPPDFIPQGAPSATFSSFPLQRSSLGGDGFEDITSAEAENWESSWFGDFYNYGYGWTFHAYHGIIHSSVFQLNQEPFNFLWFYVYSLQSYIYADEDSYPGWGYNERLNSWIYFFVDETSTDWRWMALPQGTSFKIFSSLWSLHRDSNKGELPDWWMSLFNLWSPGALLSSERGLPHSAGITARDVYHFGVFPYVDLMETAYLLDFIEYDNRGWLQVYNPADGATQTFLPDEEGSIKNMN